MLKFQTIGSVLLTGVLLQPLLASADTLPAWLAPSVALGNATVETQTANEEIAPEVLLLIERSGTVIRQRANGEIVVTAPRSSAALRPEWRAAMQVRQQLATEREELNWFRSLSRESRSAVTFGYDPDFEFRSRSLAQGAGLGLREVQAAPLIRLEF